MSQFAIVHRPSPKLGECELTFVEREGFDYQLALDQHRIYCGLLADSGLDVIQLIGNERYPDCAFVEDTAVVVDEVAIITPMGADSRRGETKLIKRTIERLRPTVEIRRPAKLEGGDVLQIGKRIFVGRSTRTNDLGINSLREILEPDGYRVVAVDVTGCLHLTTGCTAPDADTILVNSNWLDTKPFEDFDMINVADDEPFGANILRVGSKVWYSRSHQKTAGLLKERGYDCVGVDISEYEKAEAALTCLSIIF